MPAASISARSATRRRSSHRPRTPRSSTSPASPSPTARASWSSPIARSARSPISRQAHRLHQGLQRPQCRGHGAGKSRSALRRHHAGLSQSAGRRRRVRARQHRRLGDLGPVFRDRRNARWRPRCWSTSSEIGKTNSFYIANRDFASASAAARLEHHRRPGETADWAEAHRDQVGRVAGRGHRRRSRHPDHRRTGRPSPSASSPTTSSRPNRRSPIASSVSASSRGPSRCATPCGRHPILNRCAADQAAANRRSSSKISAHRIRRGARCRTSDFSSAFQLPASAADHVVRIGFQKYGKLILLKGRARWTRSSRPRDTRSSGRSFRPGRRLLEALNVGAIDFGNTGEAPPIFAQAAGAPILYIAYDPPAPQGEAILVPKDSPIKSVADLKGKKVALNKGSNVHYLLVKALEQAGVKYSEIEPVFLAPADARAAFERGAVDAWVIWDPFQAAAEAATGARTLADGTGIGRQQSVLSRVARAFCRRRSADRRRRASMRLPTSIDWAKDKCGRSRRATERRHRHPGSGPRSRAEAADLRHQAARRRCGRGAAAHRRHLLSGSGLLPKPITVSDIVRRPGS